MSENILDAREAEEQEERERQIGSEYFAHGPEGIKSEK